jgi:hypothetical protein
LAVAAFDGTSTAFDQAFDKAFVASAFAAAAEACARWRWDLAAFATASDG